MEEKHSSCLCTVFYNFQIKDFVIVIIVIVINIVVTIIVIMIAVIFIIAVLIAIVMIVIIVIIVAVIIAVIIVTESSFEVELYPEPWSFYRTNFPWPFTGH